MPPLSSSRRSSSPFKNENVSLRRNESPELQHSPILDPDQLEREGGLLYGDESELLDMGEVGQGMESLNLMDSPIPSAIASTSTFVAPKTAKPRISLRNGSPSKAKGRPSWGPKSSPAKGKMRLLEGLDSKSPFTGAEKQMPSTSTTKKERTLGTLTSGRTAKGGPQKARQSIFARPTQTAPKPRVSVDAGDGDDSFMKDAALSASTGSRSSVKERVGSFEKKKEATSSTAFATNSSPQKQSSEVNFDDQLAEVRKLNKVFDAYEQMLIQSSNQVEDFTTRISETNALLDSYIDLMRQTERTQQLLLDKDWRGVTEDEAMHALALELAEREERRRQEEREEMARLAAQRAREAEQARLAAELAQQQQQRLTQKRQIVRPGAVSNVNRARQTSTSSTRGSGLPSRGAPTTRGRGALSSSSNRGRDTATNTASAGLNNRYANVRSSGY